MIVNPRNPELLIAELKTAPLVLYGMGGAGLRVAQWCERNGVDFIFSDQDAVQKRDGGTDKDVVSPEDIKKEYPAANVVVTSIIYFDEIVEKLLSLGIDNRRILSYRLFMPDHVTWKDLETTTSWGVNEDRVKEIAAWIPSAAQSVADYGEGKSNLKKFLRPDVKYYPVDYIKRSSETILCDFNGGDFPQIKTDVSVCTATLVFIIKADLLLEHIAENTSDTVILSYVDTDVFSNIDGRKASGYVNDFSRNDITAAFSAHGFTLKETKPDCSNNIDTLYLFKKTGQEDF